MAKYELRIPDYIKQVFKTFGNEAEILSIHISIGGSAFVIEKSIVEESIIIDDDKMNLYKGTIPLIWFHPIEEKPWNIIDESREGPYFAALTRDKYEAVFIHKFDPQHYKSAAGDRYGYAIDEQQFKVESVEHINNIVKNYLNKNYKFSYVSKDQNAYDFIRRLIIFAETRDVLGKSSACGTNEDNVQVKVYEEDEFRHFVDNKPNNVLVHPIAEDYDVDMIRFFDENAVCLKSEVKEEPKVKEESKPIDPKIEQLVTMNTNAPIEEVESNELQVEELAEGEHYTGSFVYEGVKKYERLLVSHKGAYASQKIPFKGISVYHSLSIKSINNGLCKAPSNISFMKIRCRGFKGARFKTKDFEFSTEGLISAMFYREEQLLNMNTEFANANLLLNKNILKLLFLIGAERFSKLYNIAPKTDYMKIAQAVTKRFFGKELKLTELRANRIKNIYKGNPALSEIEKDNILNLVPEGYKTFIMTSWNYDILASSDLFSVKDNVSQSYLDELDLDQKILGHSVCIYNNKPIFHSSNSRELKLSTNEIIRFLNTLNDIFTSSTIKKETSGK